MSVILQALTSPEPTVLARLSAVLARDSRLTVAVLFGSRATGGAAPDSDYDIGIVSRAGLTLAEELALADELSGAAGVEIDLVRLDVDNPLVGREAARSGVCLFEAEAGAFAAFRADAISRFIDFEETIAPHRALFLRKLAGR